MVRVGRVAESIRMAHRNRRGMFISWEPYIKRIAGNWRCYWHHGAGSGEVEYSRWKAPRPQRHAMLAKFKLISTHPGLGREILTTSLCKHLILSLLRYRHPSLYFLYVTETASILFLRS